MSSDGFQIFYTLLFMIFHTPLCLQTNFEIVLLQRLKTLRQNPTNWIKEFNYNAHLQTWPGKETFYLTSHFCVRKLGGLHRIAWWKEKNIFFKIKLFLLIWTCYDLTYPSYSVYGVFFGLLCTFFNTASPAAPKIPLCQRMLGSNLVLMRLWHWQLDALVTRLDLIHQILLIGGQHS